MTTKTWIGRLCIPVVVVSLGSCTAAEFFDVNVCRHADEGTACGAGRHCRDGQCVRDDVKLSLDFNTCPQAYIARIAPLQTAVGNTIELDAVGVDADDDPLSFLWRAEGGAFEPPDTASTLYRCTGEGTHTVRLTVSDSAGCEQSEAATVECTTFCGNGILEGDERCDDGNVWNGDDCPADCGVSACGDSITSAMEDCDDGNTEAGDDCPPDCTLPVCGDGIVEGQEECDDGAVASAACTAQCSWTEEGLDGAGNRCPQITLLSVAPLETAVGRTIQLRADAIDPDGDAFTFQWAASGGSIADALSASSAFTCEVAGIQTIRLSVVDDAACRKESTVAVTCR